MNPVLMTERELLQEIWENYVLCMNACYPEARHCDNCKIQKRIDEATRCLDIIQSSGMNSGNPDSDKPNYAAASKDPLHKKEETMSELDKVQSADLNEPAEQPAEQLSAEQKPQPSAEPTSAEQPAEEPATGYYDRFTGKQIDVTKVSKKAKRSMIIKSVLWLLFGIGGLIFTIIGIINLL